MLDTEDPFMADPASDDQDGLLNGHDCPHCGIWFRLDDAKPLGKNKVKCPNCDWIIEQSA